MFKRLRRLLTAIAFCLVMLSVFGAADSVDCSVNPYIGETNHYCRYGFSSNGVIGVDKSNMLNINTEIDKWSTGYSNVYVNYYHLLEDCTVTKPIVIGENVYVGICCYKSTLTYSNDQITLPESGNGGFFVYDCTMHGCYNEKEPATTLSNGYLDFVLALNKAMNGSDSEFAIPSGYYSVDSNFDFSKYENEKLRFNDPSKTVVCLNGNSNLPLKTALTNANVKVHDNCNEPSNEHVCMMDNSIGITQEDFTLAMENSLTPVEGVPMFFHLVEDVSWDGKMELPDGCSVLICKNGFDFNVDCGNNVYVFDCEVHSCFSHEGMSFKCEEFIPLYQSMIDFVAKNSGGTVNLQDGKYALMEDIDLSAYNVEISEGAKVDICLNGFTVAPIEGILSDENVTVIDCSKLDDELISIHNDCNGGDSHATTIYVGNDEFNYLFDSNTGEFLMDDAKISLALKENITVNRPLTVQTDVDLTICLNGYTLTSSDKFDIRNYSGFIRNSYYLFTVEYGAKLTFVDCSLEKSGSVYAVNLQSNDSSTENDYLVPFEGAVANLGTLEIISGNIYGGLTPINNMGTLTVKGGSVVGLTGVMQSVADPDEYPLHSTVVKSNIQNAQIDTFLMGVYIGGGEIDLEKTQINTIYAGIFDSSANGNVASISLSEVEINVTEEHIKKIAEQFGLSYEENSLNIEQYYGIISQSPIEINGDLSVNVAPEKMYPYSDGDKIVVPELIDIKLGEDAYFQLAEGVEIGSALTVETSSDQQVVADSPSNAFVPTEGYASCLNKNNEVIFIRPEDATFLSSAIVKNCDISMDGLIKLQLTCVFDEGLENPHFLKDGNESLIQISLDNATAFTLAPNSVTQNQNGEYVYEIEVAPKDYKRELTVRFFDGEYSWLGISQLSVETVLKEHIKTLKKNEEEFSSLTEEEKQNYLSQISQNRDLYNVAVSMLNYCDVSAKYFGTENGDRCIDENFIVDGETVSVESALSILDASYLVDHKYSQEGSVAGAKLAGTSIFLESDVKLRFYFIISDLENLNVYYEINGEKRTEVELIPYAGVKNGYYFEITNIAIQDLKREYTVSIERGEEIYRLNYGVMSYVYTQLTNENASEDLILVSKSLWIYSLLAENYLLSLGG